MSLSTPPAGRLPCRPEWPDDARCVVAVSVDFDGASNELGKGIYPAGQYSHGLYSARRGVPRLLRIFERQQIPVTFFVPGRDAELFPDAVRSISAHGHEIGAHGYLHEHWDVGAEEPELLSRTHAILADLTGAAPIGWRSPSGRKTTHTTRLLRELGYCYDSSEKDYDLPYFPGADPHGRGGIVILPNNTTSLNDTPYYRSALRPPSEVFENWKNEFDACYAGVGYFVLTMHPRAGFGSGTPARAAMVERLIEYIKQHERVQFLRLGELAQYCLQHPERFDHE
jgi:peptidoglycan/xylan/chitin deacetylase (PgdA/CDA1 family)